MDQESVSIAAHLASKGQAAKKLRLPWPLKTGRCESGQKHLSGNPSRHDDYCVGPTIPVASAQRESRREVPLRGTLQIDAVYYRAEQAWQISKAQREEMAQTPPAKWKNADRQKAAVTTLELSIPCVKAGCASECTKPPVVLEDEKVWVPDITHNDEAFIARGRALNEELTRKFPQCLN